MIELNLGVDYTTGVAYGSSLYKELSWELITCGYHLNTLQQWN